jgi:predicted alpha/beta hydrolase
VILAGVLLGALAALPVEVSHRGARTHDGRTVGLVRYALGAPEPLQKRVLIVPELGFGRPLWDGFARKLAARGYVVYLAQLRGQGAMAVPGYHLRDLVTEDFPALARALAADGASHVSLIAHGFAGMLALASAGRELKGIVTRTVALSVPVEAQVPSRLVETFLLRGGRFSALGTDPQSVRLFQLVFGGGPTADRDTLAWVRGGGVNDLGDSASAELLEWMRAGDLTLSDGSTLSERIKSYNVPTYVVLPLDDGFAASEMAAPLREVSRAPVTMRALNRAEFVGEDYDHVSMVIGRRAHLDIWARALRFLEAAP